MHRSAVLCSLVMVALVSLLGGCDTYVGPVMIPNAFWGTWMVAALDEQGGLVAISMFDVDQYGDIQIIESDVFVTGGVTAAGVLTLEGTAVGTDVTAIGTMRNDDTGEGAWDQTDGGLPVAAGTFLLWRANGSAYAGTWNVTVTGPVAGGGTVTVDQNGVGNGTLIVGGQDIAVRGVVTGAGLIVVAWSAGQGQYYYGTGPATGTATGSTADGTWQDSGGGGGTWTAVKL